MSPEQNGEGKVFDFEAFKRKRDAEREAQSANEQPTQEEGDEIIKKPSEHTDDQKCVCIFCNLEKQGIPIEEATENAKKITKYLKSGHLKVNPRQLQEWVNNLRSESLDDLISRIIGLDEKKIQTHPTYSRAVSLVLKEKLTAAIADASRSEND